MKVPSKTAKNTHSKFKDTQPKYKITLQYRYQLIHIIQSTHKPNPQAAINQAHKLINNPHTSLLPPQQPISITITEIG